MPAHGQGQPMGGPGIAFDRPVTEAGGEGVELIQGEDHKEPWWVNGVGAIKNVFLMKSSNGEAFTIILSCF
jgi:hypothetical protein